jgi:tetratricopeptide (TPR) repeat protein
MANQYNNLGDIYGIRKEFDKAEEFYLKALEINESLGWQEGMASQYGKLGLIYKTRGNIDKACDYWQKSLDLYSSSGVSDQIRIISKLIADNCGKEED